MSSEQPGKVFCIGFHKTGTKSLAEALRILGYHVHGPAWVQDADACASLDNLWQKAMTVVNRFDAFQDNPWPLLWQRLAHAYPDARFILTTRPADAWLNSARRYFGVASTPMRELIYGIGRGSPIGNETLYIDRYQQHNRAVREYFAGSPRFLEMDLSAGDGWQKLCDFLQQSVPAVSFPHRNANSNPVGSL